MKSPSADIDLCEPNVYQQVFLDYSEHLRNFIYSKSGDLELAEDIVQETFVKLWVKCAIVIFAKVKSFLFTVANNIFLDNIKHNKVVLTYQKDNINNEKQETPEDVFREKEQKNKIENIINKMSEKQREVFMMSKIEGFKYKEIAERLSISVKAVEKRMGKALSTFNNEINKY